MIQPLNDYYYVKLLDPTPMCGSLYILDSNVRVRLAHIMAIPLKEELELRTGDTVYVHHHYGHQFNDDKNDLLIKGQYIEAEYLDK